jgi:pimeloyl-ACP methyl ester carboxylesterase
MEGANETVGDPLQASLAALKVVLDDATEPPILIGHSMGAVASILLAATYPDRLAGLVLTAPFLPVARHGRSSLATAADYARHRALFLANSRSRRAQRTSAVKARDFRARARGLIALARLGLRPASFHAMAARVTCPVLIVHGSDDHYVPAAFARAAAARYPTWQIALIPAVGHFPHRDEPAAWLAIVDPFLQHLLRQ